jgi:hypothetical protein
MFLGDEMMFQTEANTNFVDHKVEQCQAVELAEILGLVPTTRRVARLAFYLLPLPFPWTKLLTPGCYQTWRPAGKSPNEIGGLMEK